MRFFITSFSLPLAALLLLNACAQDVTSKSTVATASYPAGVSTDAASISAIKGIYPKSAQEAGCCWVSDDVRFRTASHLDAKSLRLRIWVPTFKPWATDPGYVAEMNAQGTTLAKAVLKSGPQDVTLPLSKNSVSAEKAVSVRLYFSGARSPKTLGLNEDSRNISAMILDVKTI